VANKIIHTNKQSLYRYLQHYICLYWRCTTFGTNELRRICTITAEMLRVYAH